VVNTSGPGAPGTVVITDGKGGAFDGTAFGSFVVKGSVSGSSVDFTISDSSYISTVIGTVDSSGTRITYSWSDKNGQKGTAYLAREGSSPPSTTTSSTATTTSPAPAGATKSATAVSCYFDVASGKDTCTAQVANAGTAPAAVPTGTVTFTNSGAGSFPAGDKCTLTASADAPGIPFCSVVFLPPDSNLPSITATYSGDGTFTSSSAETKFAQTDAPPVVDTPSPPPFAGQLPDATTMTTTVTANGTTVDTSVQTTDVNGAGLLPPLLKQLPSLTERDLSVGDFAALEDLKDAVIDLPGGLPDNDWLNEVNQRLSLLAFRLWDLADMADNGDAGAAAAYASLSRQYDQINVVARNIMKLVSAGKVALGSGDAKNTVDLRLAATLVGNTASSAKGGNATVLFRSIARHVRAGSYTVKMHFNRAELKRLAGTHKSLKLDVFVLILVPTKISPVGVPVLIAKSLTLKRR
jgi:hypothetical protein